MLAQKGTSGFTGVATSRTIHQWLKIAQIPFPQGEMRMMRALVVAKLKKEEPPASAPGPIAEVKLLTEILDLLKE
jgi:large-conductance mechanosensitive channel